METGTSAWQRAGQAPHPDPEDPTMTPAPRGPAPRTHRLLAVALPVALLTLTAACGSDDDSAAAPSSAPSSSSSSSSAPATPSAPAAGSSSAPAAEPAGGTLTASVGETAFTIDLTDSSGAKVTTLPAGTYTIQVQDPSKIHNFHLIGDGVDEETSVSGVENPTWTVELAAGDYEYVCDPHPNMKGAFTVT